MKKLFAMLLAMCLLWGVGSAMAEESETTEVMLGKVHFEIPAELTAHELIDLDEKTYLQFFTGTDYDVDIFVLDYEKAGLPIKVLTVDDPQLNNLFWCYRLFSTLIGEGEESTALRLCEIANRVEDTMPDGQALVYWGAQNMGIAAHYYRDQGCMVLITSSNENIDSARCCEIALTVASSFRIEGVTEAEMAADAEAARIAAEEAAAKAAAQKYVVITNSSANIRSGPNAEAKKITTGRKDDTFPLIGEDGNWFIIDVNGQTGYVTKSLSAIQ